MKGLVIASLRNFTIKEGKAINLPNFSIIPFEKFRKSGVLNNGWGSHIGILELQSMEANGYVAISEMSGDKNVFEDGIPPLFQFQEILLGFCHYLWFVKDHSVYIDSCFSMFPMDGGIEFDFSYPKEAINNRIGLPQETEFSHKEMRYASHFMQIFNSLYPRQSFKDLFEKMANAKVPLHRVDRAINSLFHMRGVSYLPFKVALYGPILESLFSLDKEEIGHKIAERIAFYIGKTPAERLSIYELVKRAYNVRSKYIHGEAILDKHVKFEKMDELAAELDSLLRQILTKILTKDAKLFSQPKEDLEAFFKNLIIGNTKNN